jgi:hypothetical protein
VSEFDVAVVNIDTLKVENIEVVTDETLATRTVLDHIYVTTPDASGEHATIGYGYNPDTGLFEKPYFAPLAVLTPEMIAQLEADLLAKDAK